MGGVSIGRRAVDRRRSIAWNTRLDRRTPEAPDPIALLEALGAQAAVLEPAGQFDVLPAVPLEAFVESADTAEGVGDDLLLEPQLSGVPGVPEHRPSARAELADPIARRLVDARHRGPRGPALDALHPGVHELARQRAENQDDGAVVAREHASARHRLLDGQPERLAGPHPPIMSRG